MSEITWGTLADYATGEDIRPATAQEWRRTADKLNSGYGDAYTGAWQHEGRAVFVNGGPDAEVSDEDIRRLRAEAGGFGDNEMARICDKALDEITDPDTALRRQVGAPLSDMEDRIEGMGQDGARAECARVILDARAESVPA